MVLPNVFFAPSVFWGNGLNGLVVEILAKKLTVPPGLSCNSRGKAFEKQKVGNKIFSTWAGAWPGLWVWNKSHTRNLGLHTHASLRCGQVCDDLLCAPAGDTPELPGQIVATAE